MGRAIPRRRLHGLGQVRNLHWKAHPREAPSSGSLMLTAQTTLLPASTPMMSCALQIAVKKDLPSGPLLDDRRQPVSHDGDASCKREEPIYLLFPDRR